MNRTLKVLELLGRLVFNMSLAKFLALTEACIGLALSENLQPSTATIGVLVENDTTHLAKKSSKDKEVDCRWIDVNWNVDKVEKSCSFV